MKKSFLIVAIFIVCRSAGFSQSCIPIPADTTSVWRIDYNFWEPTPWTFYGWEFRAYLAGDSTVDGKTYHVLNRSGVFTYEFFPVVTKTVFENIFYGMIRMEGSKLYGIKDYFEYLLFDFDAQAGDSLYLEYFNGIMPVVIQQVDTIVINGQNHRRYWLPDEPAGYFCARYFIEGIGHEFGLFEPIRTFEDYAYLNCYAEKGESIYIQDTMRCDFTIGIPETTVEKQQMKVYPNPAKGYFTIENTGGMHEDAYLTDITGKIVARYQLSKVLNNCSLTGLKPGIYFYQIGNNINGYHGKLIINN